MTGLQMNHRYGTVQVFGYTDSTGTDAVNLRLSEMRAEVVAAFLRAQLDPALFTVVPQGLGATDFIAGNDTAHDRQKNRRVEIEGAACRRRCSRLAIGLAGGRAVPVSDLTDVTGQGAGVA